MVRYNNIAFSNIIQNIESFVDFSEKPDLVVFSHLRWNSVFQRPQHLMSRFAKDRKILFVEEPIQKETNLKSYTYSPTKNIRVLVPYVSFSENMQEFSKLIKRKIAQFEFKKPPVLWFYSPAFVNLIQYIKHQAVVYDCMDELSKFKFAPSDLIDNETLLLKNADLVFTGGKSLYEAKKVLKSDTFCFPSSVDTRHFKVNAKFKVPMDVKKLKNPKVLFYGVLDERIDTNLLQESAKRLPNIDFVVIGPVVKISEQDLPKLPNIHYLGKKSYDQLPVYLANSDIAMMPFAINDATKFISPTKTLEYMAAYKPIISTPIKDVVRDYRNAISIVKNAKEFERAVKRILKKDLFYEKKLKLKYDKILAKTSWLETARSMDNLIHKMLKYKKLKQTFSEKGIDLSPSWNFNLNY